MASRLNSCSTLAENGQFTGKWEDVQSYTSITVVVENGHSSAGSLHLQWVNMPGKNIPDNDTTEYTIQDTITYPLFQTSTYQFKIKAKWFRVHVQPGGATFNVAVSTTYKDAPTEIQLGDKRSNMLSINPASAGNSLYTVLVDQGGELLGTTNALAGEAMYTHLSASGSSLATTFDGIMRSVTDVSFILTTGDEGYGTILPESNSFRLPRSQIKFRDGDIINMGMGLLDDTDFEIAGSDPNIYEISGILISGLAKYQKVEDDYVQFQVMTNINISEWLDPSIGFNSPILNLPVQPDGDVFGLADTGKNYFKQVRNDGTLNRVDDYYNAIATDPSFLDIQSGQLSGSLYPFDVRLYRGSLAHKYYALDISHTPFTTGSFPSGPNQLANGTISPNIDVSLMYNIVDTETPGYTLFANLIDPPTSLYIGNIRWTSSDPKIKDYFGRWIDATTNEAARPFQVRVVEDFDNLHILSINLDSGGTGRPTDTLGVSIRDGQNVDIDTTKGVDTYYFDPDRPTGYGNNVVFMMDSSFAYGLSDVSNSVTAFLGVTDSINTNISIDGSIAVVLYDAGNPGWIVEMGQEFGGYNLPNASGHYNLWNALMSPVFPTIDIDTIVVFHYGDDISATFLERQSFDACASYFDSINRIVVTRSDRDTTDLLPFAGSTNNILYYDSNPTTFSTDTSFQETLAKRIAGRAQTGHNAVYIVNTDVSGHPQAGTDIITSNLGDGVAMYYSLADNSGISISTTNTDDGSDNALYVTLANGNVGVTTDNPLNVAVQETTKPGLMFHYSISGYPVSSTRLGNNSLRITHLGAANETGIPLWLKVYDMSTGYFNDNSGATLGIEASAFTLKDKLVYNLAVPPMDYRDIEFPKGLAINDGLYLATSTTHAYDSYGTIGAARMYVQGQFFDTSGPANEWDLDLQEN